MYMARQKVCYCFRGLASDTETSCVAQSGESWKKVMHAKANGGVNMDLATRHCKDLEHFVMWSSFVASAGNEGTGIFQRILVWPILLRLFYGLA